VTVERRSVGPADIVCVRAGVTARDFDGEWVLLDLEGGNYFGLDEIGGHIWRDLLEGRTPKEIATRLAATYAETEAVILEDVLQLADELVERGLAKIGTQMRSDS
jgi:hypothetical protein